MKVRPDTSFKDYAAAGVLVEAAHAPTFDSLCALAASCSGQDLGAAALRVLRGVPRGAGGDDAMKLPELPLAALGPGIGPFADAVATACQVPPALPAIGALCTLSAAALKRVRVHVRAGWYEHLALYGAAVTPPGERKTATLKEVTRPLREYERDTARVLAPSVLESERAHADAAARVRKLSDKAASATKDSEKVVTALVEARRKLDALPPRVRAPRWFMDDTTPEALARRLSENDGRMGVFSSEGGLLETMAGRYSDGVANLDLLLKGWDGAEEYIYDRVGLYLRIDSPLLAVCLFIQPDVVTALSSKPGFRGRGLIGRFLFVWPESTLGHRDVAPPPVPGELRRGWQATVERVAGLEDRRDARGEVVPRVLELEPEALAALLDYMRKIEGRLGLHGDLRPISDWAGKHVGTCARIAGLLHLADAEGNEGRPIPVGTIHRSIRLGRVLIEHAAATIGRMEGQAAPAQETEEEREIREAGAWLSHRPGGGTARELAGEGPRCFRRRPDAAEIVLEKLVERGRARVEVGPRGGRTYFTLKDAPHVAADAPSGNGSAGGASSASASSAVESDADDQNPFGTELYEPFGTPAVAHGAAPSGAAQAEPVAGEAQPGAAPVVDLWVADGRLCSGPLRGADGAEVEPDGRRCEP